MASQFAQLVSLACHDLRTPLATASGFAHTLERVEELGHPADRYVHMIGEATDQLAELLDLLSALTRIESGRFEAQLQAVDTRELANAAAERLDEGRVVVEGDGIEVDADPKWAAVGLAAIAEAARRHGGLEKVTLRVDGPRVSVAPVVEGAGPIAVGEEVKDFAAAVCVQVLTQSGASVALDGEVVTVRFPSAGGSRL